MKNKSKGIILYMKKIKDNDLYVKILSKNDKIDSGIVYGGNSSKKKNIYQIGFFIEYNTSQKNENAPLSIIAEISHPFLSVIFDDKYKMYALLSIVSLVNISIVDGQYVKDLYSDVENLINKIIEKKHWIITYCNWLFILLKKIGYEIDYNLNKEYKYYDTYLENFTNNANKHTIEFPHNLFSELAIVNAQNIIAIFKIFESIFIKNHLDNINYIMPSNFIKFKQIIVRKLTITNA